MLSCVVQWYTLQAGKYAWVENWSEEHQRPFYYDQQNHVSTWDKPADLAWRRVFEQIQPGDVNEPKDAPQDETR